jgi:hypothetical protein
MTTMTYCAIAYWLILILIGFIVKKFFTKEGLEKEFDYIEVVIVATIVFFISPPVHELIILFGGKQ